MSSSATVRLQLSNLLAKLNAKWYMGGITFNKSTRKVRTFKPDTQFTQDHVKDMEMNRSRSLKISSSYDHR